MAIPSSQAAPRVRHIAANSIMPQRDAPVPARLWAAPCRWAR